MDKHSREYFRPPNYINQSFRKNFLGFDKFNFLKLCNKFHVNLEKNLKRVVLKNKNVREGKA